MRRREVTWLGRGLTAADLLVHSQINHFRLAKYSNTSTRELFNSYHNSSHSRSSRSCSSWSTSSSAPSPPGGCGAARTEGGRRGGSDAFGPSSGMVDLCSPRRTAPVPPPLAGAGAGAGLCPVPSLGRRSRSNCSRSSSWLGLGLGLGYI